MIIKISIRIVDGDGEPLPYLSIYAEEAVYFTDQADESETDDEGWAHLSFDAFGSEMTLEIYIENKFRGKHRVWDGKTLSFTYEE